MGTSAQPSDLPVKILIAEDSPTQAQRLRHILEQQGYEVGVASNGRLALEMASSLRPAAVISDVVMPEMDGYELSRRMKANAELRDIPVILVTTMSDPQDVIRGLECGADNFVLKPYDENYLLARVRYVLVNREMRRPQDASMGVEIYFNDRRHLITADRLQILNLLLSTYDAAVQRNAKLSQMQEELRGINTALVEVNRRLQQESRQREQAQQSLRQSEQRLRSIVDNMAALVGEITPDGILVEINRAALETGGLQRQDVIGKRFTETPWFSYSPTVQARLGEDIERALRGETVRHDMVAWMAGSTLVPVDFMLVPVHDSTGRVVKLILSGIDITERKYFEQTLQEKNAALEAADRAKSTFLATMSHEIRTPMNGVLGMLELLNLTKLNTEQRTTLEIARVSGKSLLRIIDDILDFSKIEAGRLELERAPVALPDLIESVCDTLLPMAINKGVELSLFISPQVPDQVWSDATRLRQVLFNLAGNAIKFSAGGFERRGRVSIRVDVAAGETPRLVLRIADNGIGMAPEMLPHLFSSFTQAEASTTRRFGGTGLGLAICKRLVTLMNGEIDVESSLGEGSTFTVTLPVEVVDGGTVRTDPDVAGLDCIVVGADVHADDLRAYLEHAGARVHPVADLDAAVLRATGLSRPVVIQNTRRDSASTDALHAAFAAAPDVRHLLIARGLRRRTRMTAADVVTLDGNCLRRSSLLRAVAVAVGRASPEVLHENDEENLAAERAPPTTVAEARAQGRLLLIAEDDEVNQKVILSQIQMLGYAAEIADNGVEALYLWRAGHYALLLTDLHMPEMDGYALAEAIRREEPQRSSAWQQRMPILALTANALRGEAVRAQAAGMDEYLTKPLQLQLLKAALKKWLPRDAGDTAPGTLPGELHEDSRSAPAPSVLDIAVLVGLVGDDPQVARKFLADYRATKGHLASELRAARAADDIRQIGAIAHKLKSSSRSVGALVLGDLCAELENACRTGAREGISQGMMQFEAALLAVDTQIDHLLARR